MKNNAIRSTPTICWATDFDTESLFNMCDNIAIIRVISVDKMEMKPLSFGTTYGKVIINNVIYGDMTEGSIIEFGKSGGIIDVQTLEDETKQKHEIPKDMESFPKNKIYFNIVLEDDYSIEEGKTYLAYLRYVDEMGLYQIIGLGYGLRELDLPKEKYIEKVSIDYSNTRILNREGFQEFNNIYFDKNILINV